MDSLGGLLVCGTIIVAGLYAGRLSRYFQLPALIGYMLVGLSLGPHMTDFLTAELLHHLNFLVDLGLGLVAFTIGAELHLKQFRKMGKTLLMIILAETLGAFFIVAASIGYFSGDWALGILLGAIAAASAPAGTVAVIQECHAQGPLTRTIYAVVGLDDALSVVVFGFALVAAKSIILQSNGHGGDESLLYDILKPMSEILGACLLGWAAGRCYVILVRNLKDGGDVLALTIGLICLICGICEWLHFSLILANMVIGVYLVNSGREGIVRRVREKISTVMPLMFILFFALAGAHLDVGLLSMIGLVGLVYIVSRIIGKAGGAWVGGVWGRAPSLIRKNLGIAILSQAGLAVGLALIVHNELSALERMGVHAAAEVAAVVLTTITATTVVFEVIGPILTRWALVRAGEINAPNQ